MKAKIFVRLKPSVLDPQGKAILGAVKSLGFENVESVRQGKVFDITLGTTDAKEAQLLLERLSQYLIRLTPIGNCSLLIITQRIIH